MQLDEDVGKVAQATPILICKYQQTAVLFPILTSSEYIIAKALELFMQSLIDQACQESRERSAKRLTVAHL